MDVPTPRDGRDPAPSVLLRPTDRGRRALRRAQLVLGAAAVTVAVPVGMSVAAQVRPESVPAALVQAELLEPPAVDVAVVGTAVPTPARWSAPDGSPRTGLLWADADAAAGTTVVVGVDAAGGLFGPENRGEDPRLTGLLAGTGTLLSCWLLLALVGFAGRARLAALDLRRWGTEWLRVEPVWSSRS